MKKSVKMPSVKKYLKVSGLGKLPNVGLRTPTLTEKIDSIAENSVDILLYKKLQATNKRYREALEKIVDTERIDESDVCDKKYRQAWNACQVRVRGIARTALNPMKTPQEEK
jgi:hypothetical protein